MGVTFEKMYLLGYEFVFCSLYIQQYIFQGLKHCVGVSCTNGTLSWNAQSTVIMSSNYCSRYAIIFFRSITTFYF